MPLGVLTFRIKQLQFTKITQNEFSKSLVKEQLSTATLSYSPIFIIGLMSTGRLISGCALGHSRRSKDAQLRDRFRVADNPPARPASAMILIILSLIILAALIARYPFAVAAARSLL